VSTTCLSARFWKICKTTSN